jgi:hypothetical protein
MASTITVTAVLNNLISPQLTRISTQLNTVSDRFKFVGTNATNSISKTTKGMTELGKKIETIAAGALLALGAGFTLITKSIIESTAEMEKYQAVLTNTFGSENQAKASMQMITDFAIKTPFQIDKLTESYVKLVNQGFTPTEKEMTSLGDLASSTGKEFDQLVEAMLDAQTGEFERLKTFGITANTEGDKVKFTFKNVTTEVDKTSEAMREYILSLGNLKGVSGSMTSIVQSLTGTISNLKDTVQQFGVSIGNVFSDSLQAKIISVDTLLEKIKPTVISILTQFKNLNFDFDISGGKILSTLLESINKNFYIFKDVFDSFKPAVTDFFSSISKLFGSDGSGLTTLFKVLGITLKTALTPMYLLLKALTYISDAVVWIKTKFDALSTRLQNVVKILSFALMPIITLVVAGFKLITNAINNSIASAKKLVDTTNELVQPTRNAEDRYARIEEKLIGINLELEAMLANNLLIDMQALSTDPFAWMDEASDKMNKLQRLNVLLKQKANLSTVTAPTASDITSTDLGATAGLDETSTTLTTDRSVTNITLDIAKVVESGGIVLQTTNMTENSAQISKIVENALVKALVDATNIKLSK